MTETRQMSDPRYHAARIKEMLREVRDRVREDIDRVDDPRAEALFETTAEVLSGLETAYDHFERAAEESWR
ncbi:MAG: hypothetical protein HY321_05255 [Armatimonadetes bacterium]|nr:hypothetical protein [Armatimonadota bacterium]